MSSTPHLSRRRLLRGGVAIGGGAVLGAAGLPLASPALALDRPVLTHGVQSGDVDGGSAVVWTRADRGSRMWVEWSTRADFRRSRTVRGPVLRAGDDFTGKTRLRHLPDGETIHYRVWAEDRRSSQPRTGSFRATPKRGQDVRFVWTADVAGQGWGSNPDLGGYALFDDMAAVEPDFFVCSGDFYYGDNPLSERVELPDGRIWRNTVTDAKLKVAESLDEFRGQYRYNLEDSPLRKLLATTPMINEMDDHEVVNNWYPGELHDDRRYTEKRVDVLAARARKAFAEYTPTDLSASGRDRMYRRISHGPLLDVFVLDMRTFKDPNTRNDSPDGGTILGRRQLEWLKRELRRSTATWKVIANSLPLGLVVADGPENIEGVGQRDDGAPLGRETEIAELLSFVKARKVTGTVWITADVHYTAAHSYDPSRAAFTDFDPFWEFVAGPANAGAFGPNALDTTFGAKAEFVKAPGPDHQNTSPLDGFQFFGEVSIDAASRALTVRLVELGGTEVYRKTLTA